MTSIAFTTDLIAAGLDGVALLGCVQAVAGAGMLGWFRNRARAAANAVLADRDLPAVTVLKPLHGDEPMLEQALRGFILQDYPALQIVFGVQDANDPAIAVVQRLRSEFPTRDLCLVIDPLQHGPNRKVGNLINMLPHAVHDLLVIADSDIHVAPDYLRQIARSFAADPAVGLVTTLYHGIPASPSVSRRMAAGQINHNFMPGVLLSRLLGRQDCLGSTMALYRDTLDAVGGLPMLSTHVADDSVLGKLVRGLGRTIAIAPTLTATTITDSSPRELFEHEVRWGRTVRAVEPLGYALSAVQFPLFWASLALLVAPVAGWTLTLFAAIWVLRALTAARIDWLIAAFGRSPSVGESTRLRGAETMPALLLPLRDWVSAIIMASSFTGSQVNWRGQTLRVAGWTTAPRSPGVRYGHTPAASVSPRSLSSHPLTPHQILVHAHQTLVQGD